MRVYESLLLAAGFWESRRQARTRARRLRFLARHASEIQRRRRRRLFVLKVRAASAWIAAAAKIPDTVAAALWNRP